MGMKSRHVMMEDDLWDQACEAADKVSKRLSKEAGQRVRVTTSDFVRSAIEAAIARETAEQDQPRAAA